MTLTCTGNVTFVAALPCDKAVLSSHVAMVVTKYGGHIGFLEGVFPRNASYVDRLFAQFMETIFCNGSELETVLSIQEKS